MPCPEYAHSAAEENDMELLFVNPFSSTVGCFVRQVLELHSHAVLI
jgi:hypothetical protein